MNRSFAGCAVSCVLILIAATNANAFGGGGDWAEGCFDHRLDSKSVEFSTDGKHVSMRFDPALKLGEKKDLFIDYVCDHPTGGMTFTPGSPDAPNYTAEVHTQGEEIGNRHWFICHDWPNERM